MSLVYEQVVDGNQDLFLIPASGGPTQRLTDHPAKDHAPRWTPDGRSVLFASERSGNWQIWEVPAGGGVAQRVRTNAHREWQVDASPEGSRLAFLSSAEGPEYLYVMARASREAKALVRHEQRSVLGNPDWSPDGRTLVFSSNRRMGHHVYRVDLAHGKEERLSSLAKGGCEPRFSPDGRKVAYVTRRHLRKTSEIVEHDLDTGRERILTDWPALNYDPAYSPDGTEIAFASNVTGEFALYRLRLADGKAWRLTFGAGPTRYPDYRPLR